MKSGIVLAHVEVPEHVESSEGRITHPSMTGYILDKEGGSLHLIIRVSLVVSQVLVKYRDFYESEVR